MKGMNTISESMARESIEQRAFFERINHDSICFCTNIHEYGWKEKDATEFTTDKIKRGVTL
jgi:hypothetical protein